MTDKELELTEMMYNTGNYVVHSSGGGYFWANTNVKGCLIEAVDNDDLYIIQKLARERRLGVKHEIKRL